MFQRRVSAAVKLFMSLSGASADDVAIQLGITRGTFYAKLCGARNWVLDDLQTLAALGVDLPELATTYMRHPASLAQAKKGKK